MNWTSMALAVMSIAAVPALAQTTPPPVRILRPAPEQTVRGIVPISINALSIPNAGAGSGYMVVEINDEFISAVAPEPNTSSVTYYWNTKDKLGDTGVVPKDGQYTIRVKTYDARHRFARSNELNVYVKNLVSVAPNKTFNLRYRFKPGEELNYVEKVTVRSAGQEVYSANVPLTLYIDDFFNGVYEARERIDPTATETVSTTVQAFGKANQRYGFQITPAGAIVPGRKMQRMGWSPSLNSIVFPNRPLRVGDSWTSRLNLTPYYNGVQSAVIDARHVLSGFEYYLGRPAAKILSEYDASADVSVGGAAGGGMPGAIAPTGTPGTPASVRFKGKRVTWFDHVSGRVLRSEDNLTADFGGMASTGGGNPYGGGYTDTTGGSGASITIVMSRRS